MLTNKYKLTIIFSIMLIIFGLMACDLVDEKEEMIMSFDFTENVVEDVSIDQINLSILVEVEAGTNVSNLTPIIETSENFEVIGYRENSENDFENYSENTSINFEESVEFKLEGQETIKIWEVTVSDSVPENMAFVEAGTSSDYLDLDDITLNYDIYVSKHQVTFAEYDEFVEDANRNHSPDDEGWGRGERPVIDINWSDAAVYANWLSDKEGLEPAYNRNTDVPGNYELKDNPGNLEGYRLLTSKEWEYAARGGKDGDHTMYAGSDNLGEVGWYNDNADGVTQPVGEKKPNELGIYDMSGNVMEWVNDTSNDEKIRRNGGANNSASDCEVAHTGTFSFGTRWKYQGFRIARTVTP